MITYDAALGFLVGTPIFKIAVSAPLKMSNKREESRTVKGINCSIFRQKVMRARSSEVCYATE